MMVGSVVFSCLPKTSSDGGCRLLSMVDATALGGPDGNWYHPHHIWPIVTCWFVLAFQLIHDLWIVGSVCSQGESQ